MKLDELIRDIPHTGGGEQPVHRIEYNSHKSCAGDLFVCLVGSRIDGHQYAAHAYENGCRLFLCQHPVDLPDDAVQVITPDTRAALPIISAQFYGHPADRLKLIGITGTKGKTTTALLIAAILNSAGHKCAYIGSNGVIIDGVHTETVNTTPESRDLQHYFRLMVDAGTNYAVIEVSSQALAHHRVDGLPFDTVVFTNLSEDHIGPGEHPDFDNYRSSKKLLFSDYDSNHMICNIDDEASTFMTEGYKGQIVTVGIENAADYRGTAISKYRTGTALGVEFDCVNGNWNTRVRMMSPGSFSVYNGLCAIAVCSCYGISKDFSASVLAKTPVQGRFEIVEGIPDRTLVIDYSHNGLSLTKALETLREYEPANLICVFGSVGGRTQCRRKELAEAASRYADYCIITSDNPDYEDPDAIIAEIASHMAPGARYTCIAKREKAIFEAIRISAPGDIILFAGKGHERYQLVSGHKIPFVESNIIKEACRSLSTVE